MDDGGTGLERELADLLAVRIGAAHPYTALELSPALGPGADGGVRVHGHAAANRALTHDRGLTAGGSAIDALLGDAPGPSLAAKLAGAEPADLDDTSLVELLAAWERLAAWAQAGSAAALGELLHRTRGSSRHEFVVDEVSASLGLSRHAAAQHVAVAHGAHAIPEVADAMSAGAVDRRKAEALVSTGRLDDARRREVVRELRPDLEHLTVRQIRDRLRRAEIAADPAGAAERHTEARRTRSVVLEPVDDAMAYLTAYLPADDAARAFAAIDGTGVAMHRTPGEVRRLDECRADALVALVTGAVEPAAAGVSSGTRPSGTQPSGTHPSSTQASGVQVTIAASTLLGTDDLPAILAGYGPIPAPMARTIATDPDATWQRILTDPVSGVLTDRSPRSYRPSPALRAAVVARDATCTFPGCFVPASRGDLDHIEPFERGHDGPQTHGDNLHPLCRAHHRAKTTGGWSVARDPVTGASTWTSPTQHRYVRAPYRADPARSRPRPRTGDAPPPF
ncbi:HNH endonuclease [Isoptericola sp. S6320L]|uniref:HNH endonuclease signature motif containing protein n=1 Tax=Isoptericola sp. S6320L TaxID=2926411 RepID=UPI001FF4FC39|nr:HNH endonuclease signature motif containing protein [Isoptericola sp. S6320L]MCK0117580.1 HNH endonuclease [Isoptericola sp. S6320L]